MNYRKFWVHLLAIVTLCLAAQTFAEDEVLQCRSGARFLAPAESSEQLKYAPNRDVEVLHLALDITPDFKEQSIEGKATLRFKPIAQPCQELRLDAVDLTVNGVGSTERIKAWQNTDKQIVVTFERPIPPKQEASLSISYGAHPRTGLFFRTPEMGYKPEDMHLWTQSEAEMARNWFPCFDAPNQKFTSEITCRVPEKMVVLSNGKLMSKEKDSGSGLVAVRWLQDKPHVSYLMFLAAGHFKGIYDRYKDVPLAFYTPASDIAYASNSFQGTKDMFAYFEKETGVPYPWAKYDQVCLNDFTAGGMENTTITALNDNTLHTPDFEDLRSSEGLIAHELVHQWFGDLVTCKDWANIWLNEGFATYYEHLYYGHKHGQELLRLRLHESRKSLTGHVNPKAIVRRNYAKADDLFDDLAYGKGAWVLHMLRSQLGSELYQKCIKTYLQRYQYKCVTTEDFKGLLEELSGRSLDQFFNQWIYHGGHPELNISYSWDEQTKLARLSVQQAQTVSADVLLFNVPLPIRFQMKNSGPVERTITIKEKTEDFHFPLPEAPELVRIDPNVTVLAKINFTPPSAMVYVQLDSKDGVARVIAIEQLSGKKEAFGKLKEILNNDPFYPAREAASKAIRAMQGDAALDALLASRSQKDARVRRQVIADIASFYDEKSCQALLRVLDEEKNPEIRAAAAVACAAYDKPEIETKLRVLLGTPSFQNILADAAISGLRAQEDTSSIQRLLQMLQDENAFTVHGFAKNIETLAWLARNQSQKEPVREFLLRHLNSHKKRVRIAAISALGTLGDTKAIAPLETFTAPGRETSERSAAERALAALRESRKPSFDVTTLRADLSKLQKENRELRKELDELKKKVESVSKRSDQPAPAKTSAK